MTQPDTPPKPAQALSSARANRRPLVTVMSYNLYLGADLTPIIVAAQSADPTQVLAAITVMYRQALASDYPTRATAVAGVIAQHQPHLVGLQEAVGWQAFSGPDLESTDFVHLILAELSALGRPYRAAVVASGFDRRLPTSLGYPVRLTVGDVILARADLPEAEFDLTGAQAVNYAARIAFTVSMPGGAQAFEMPRQWASVDVSLEGVPFRFVTTHLESAVAEIRKAQAAELLQIATDESLPTILVGDLNATLDAVEDASWLLTARGGFVDAWTVGQKDGPGSTCCQEPTLRLPSSTLAERIDLILTRGGFQVMDAYVAGDDLVNDPADPGQPVLWASDHAAVLARLSVPGTSA